MKTKRSAADAVFILLTACIFALAAMLAIAFGATQYGRVADSTGGGDGELAAGYLMTRLREADADAADVCSFGGLSAVLLEDGDGYATYIYCLDGMLMELYCDPLDGLAPEDGEAVLALAGLTFTAEDGAVRFVLTTQAGERFEALYVPRGESGWRA